MPLCKLPKCLHAEAKPCTCHNSQPERERHPACSAGPPRRSRPGRRKLVSSPGIRLPRARARRSQSAAPPPARAGSMTTQQDAAHLAYQRRLGQQHCCGCTQCTRVRDVQCTTEGCHQTDLVKLPPARKPDALLAPVHLARAGTGVACAQPAPPEYFAEPLRWTGRAGGARAQAPGSQRAAPELEHCMRSGLLCLPSISVACVY